MTRMSTTNKNVGATCPYCQSPIKPGVGVASCTLCGVPHHRECWDANGGCTTFGCTCRSGDPVARVSTARPAAPRREQLISARVALSVLSLCMVACAGVFLFLSSSRSGAYLRAVQGELSALAATDRTFAHCLDADSVCGQSVVEACESAESAISSSQDRLSSLDPPGSMKSLHRRVRNCLNRHAGMYRLIKCQLQDRSADGSEIVICWDGLQSDYKALSEDFTERFGELPGFSRRDAARCAGFARRLSEFRMQRDAAEAYCDYVDSWIRCYNKARDDLAAMRKQFEADPYARSDDACRAIAQEIVRREGLRSDIKKVVPPEHFSALQSRLLGTIDDGIGYARLVTQWACVLYVYPSAGSETAAKRLQEARSYGQRVEVGITKSRSELARLRRAYSGDPMKRSLL